MGTLLLPIFAFGCVITGIVMLGVLQARDFARSSQVNGASNSVPTGSNNGQMLASAPGLAGVDRLSHSSQP